MSGVVLDELFRSLVYKEGNEKITKQEAEVFQQWKSQTIRRSLIEGSVASGLVWFATRRLNSFNRFTLSGGAAFLTGVRRLQKSVDACVDRILGMEGSRMQLELKQIIMERYGNNPEKMKLFSKHFYCEEVFNDSTPGHPVPVYRPRSLYVDDNRTSDNNTSQESVKRGVHHPRRNDDLNVQLNSGSASKQVPMKAGLGAFGYGDPLDVLFGHSSQTEERPYADASENSVKAQTRIQRKERRKLRARCRHKEPLSAEATQYQVA